MAKCAFCSTTILFGGRQNGELRFCNADCEAKGVVIVRAQQVPDTQVREESLRLHAGRCPRCDGEGPVDLHTSYRVWSAVVMTQWSSRPAVSCRSCATKRALGDATYSLVLGWWGFPWGPLMTPVQVVRNVVAMVRKPDPAEPSEALRNAVRMQIAQNGIQPASTRMS